MLGTCSTYPNARCKRSERTTARDSRRVPTSPRMCCDVRVARKSACRSARLKRRTPPSVRMCCDTQMTFLASSALQEQRAATRGSDAARPISSHVPRCPNVSLEQGALSSAPRRAAQTPRASSARMCCGDQMPFWSQARCKNSTPRRAAQTPSAASTRICCDTRIGLWTKAR